DAFSSARPSRKNDVSEFSQTPRSLRPSPRPRAAYSRGSHTRPGLFSTEFQLPDSDDFSPATPSQRSTRVTSSRGGTLGTRSDTSSSRFTGPPSSAYSTSHVIDRVIGPARKVISGDGCVPDPGSVSPRPAIHSPAHGTHTPTIAPGAPAASMARSVA